MSQQKARVLFLTNSEFGQASVVLAVIHSLIHLSTHVRIHVASFESLEALVNSTSEYAVKTAPSHKKAEAAAAVFHVIRATPYRRLPIVRETYDLTPGLVNSARGILAIPEIMMPWEPLEFTHLCREVKQIVEEVKPELIVVDPLFAPGLTVCNQLQAKWIVLAPNTIKDFVVPVQPHLASLWKYPIVCSALPFPVPWRYVPLNFSLNLVAAYMTLCNNRLLITAKQVRNELGDDVQLLTANELGVLKKPPDGVRLLVSSSLDLDYPFAHIPEYVVPCGPIVRAAKRIADEDGGLLQWLRRGPTVYVNLGTYLRASVDEAAELALALRDMVHEADRANYGGHRKLQVIWKLLRADESKLSEAGWSGPWERVLNIISPEIDEGRILITDWVTAEPKAILESGYIICNVNHGGANSFNEALCAGVPQVVLPAWADCYDFGNRVELLGIGRWANKVARPRWEHIELGRELIATLLGPSSTQIRERALRLAERYPEAAGRNYAAGKILATIDAQV